MSNTNTTSNTNKIRVQSEIGKLKRVMIHCPGVEMNNMLPNLRLDWLFEDTVYTKKMQEEYAHFFKLLLLFTGSTDLFVDQENDMKCNPEDSDYCLKADYEVTEENDRRKNNVHEILLLLAKLFSENHEKTRELIISICSFHKLHIYRRDDLLGMLEWANAIKKGDKKKTKKYRNGVEVDLYLELAKTLISGKLEWDGRDGGLEDLTLKEDKKNHSNNLDHSNYIFEPVPNLIFTRDIGVTLNNRLLITKPRYDVRYREILLLRFIAENYLFDKTEIHSRNNIIEMSDDDDFFQYEKTEKKKYRVNFEGGDIMMISPKHILIGNSERTSNYAIQKFVHAIFKLKIGVEIISVVKIAKDRAQMHLDTILTQVNKNVWMLHWMLSEKKEAEEAKKYSIPFNHLNSISLKNLKNGESKNPTTILQFFCPAGTHEFHKDFFIYHESELDTEKNPDKITYKTLKEYAGKTYGEYNYEKPKGLEDLLTQISKNEFNQDEVRFVYSGSKEFPYSEREQWTDACNLLCVGNGVVIGYDRNNKTAENFEEAMKDLYINVYKKDLPEKHLTDFHFVMESTELLERIKGKDKEWIDSYLEGIHDTLITLPSSELSRARGGSHCMSMPLEREDVEVIF
jgi:arginine deiminase